MHWIQCRVRQLGLRCPSHMFVHHQCCLTHTRSHTQSVDMPRKTSHHHLPLSSFCESICSRILLFPSQAFLAKSIALGIQRLKGRSSGWGYTSLSKYSIFPCNPVFQEKDSHTLKLGFVMCNLPNCRHIPTQVQPMQQLHSCNRLSPSFLFIPHIAGAQFTHSLIPFLVEKHLVIPVGRSCHRFNLIHLTKLNRSHVLVTSGGCSKGLKCNFLFSMKTEVTL